MNRIFKNELKNSDSLTAKFLVGFLIAFNYALYPALITIFAVAYSGNNVSTQEKVAVGFALVAGKELFSFLAVTVAMGPMKIYKIMKKSLFTKSGALTSIAGIFGGPIGYSFVTVSALFVGGALAAVLVSTTTIFTALGERFLIKRKFSVVKIVGLAISGIAVMAMPLFDFTGQEFTMEMLLGYLFAFFGVIS